MPYVFVDHKEDDQKDIRLGVDILKDYRCVRTVSAHIVKAHRREVAGVMITTPTIIRPLYSRPCCYMQINHKMEGLARKTGLII